MTPKFKRAVEYVLLNEGLGNVTNYAVDRGGLTKWGITRGALQRYQDAHGLLLGKRVPDLSRDDAIEIYWTDFWRFEGIASERVAIKLFDIYVPLSPVSAVKVYQRAANDLGARLAVDGILGPKTIAALDEASPELLLDEHPERGRPDAETCGALVRRLAEHHINDVKENPPQIAFLAGWLARAWRVPV